VTREDPRQIFGRFVCDPAPPSATNLQVVGYLGTWGDSLLIRFRIDPGDFDSLLQHGNFQRINEPGWADVARGHLSEWLPECESPTFFEQRPVKCRREPGVNLVFLMVNTNRDQCWFRYVHPGP
jgi:hypothetical protein